MNPEAYNKKVLDELTAIRRTVEAIARHLNAGATSGTNGASQSNGSQSARAGQVASDHDLDGTHGDFTIKYMPKEKWWRGEDFTGYKLSETTVEFLETYAKYLDAYGSACESDPDEKKRKGASFKFKDAGRARGWARRLANGWGQNGQTPASNAPSNGDDGYGSDDDIPF